MSQAAAIPQEIQQDIVDRLERGESYAAIARRHLLNPVTIGAIGAAHGFKAERGQKSADARRGITLRQTEKEFQAQVIKAAALLRWTVYHTWLSKHSTAGFPDLVLVRAPRVIVAELKAELGKLTPAQEHWRAEFAGCPGVEYFVWRPSDWDALSEVLR